MGFRRLNALVVFCIPTDPGFSANLPSAPGRCHALSPDPLVPRQQVFAYASLAALLSEGSPRPTLTDPISSKFPPTSEELSLLFWRYYSHAESQPC